MSNNGVQLKGSYSKSETKLFGYLPKDGSRITSKELVDLRRKHERWRIDHPSESVSLIMRTLIKKVRERKERVRIHKTRQLGPYPTEYWLEDLDA